MDAADWQQKSNGLPKAQTNLYYPGAHGRCCRVSATITASCFSLPLPRLPSSTWIRACDNPAVPTAANAHRRFQRRVRRGSLSTPPTITATGLRPPPLHEQYRKHAVLQQLRNHRSGFHRPGGQILLSAFPLPNVDPLAHEGNNLITDFTTSDPRNQEILRMDYALNDNTHFSGRYNHENESVPWPYGPYNQWNQVPYPAYQTGKDASNSINLTMTNVLSSTLTNEASLAYTRFTLEEALSNLGGVSLTALAYPYPNLFSTSSGIIPNVDFEGSSQINNDQLYIGGGEAPPFLSAQNSYTFNESLTKLKGKHLLKAGFFAQTGRFNRPDHRQRQRLRLRRELLRDDRQRLGRPAAGLHLANGPRAAATLWR